MKRAFLLGLLILLLPTLCWGIVYIDIEAPGHKTLPIAVAPFMGNPVLGTKARQILKSDLEYTGFFNVLKEDTFLGEKPSAEVDFKRWQLIGAYLLIKGRVEKSGNKFQLDLRLYDVNKGLELLAKRYTGAENALRYAVHRFMDNLMQVLSGEPSVFQTMIAFVYKTKRGKEIYITDFDGYRPRSLTQFHNICLSPKWSPLGDKLLFTSYKRGNPDVYLLDIKKGIAKRIIHYPGLNIGATWSPDAKRIAVTLSIKGRQGIYLVNNKGRIERCLVRSSGINVSPTWSPDGKKLAFVSDRSGCPQIYILDLTTNKISRLTYEGNYNVSPAWSPKGDYIVYAGIKDGHFQLFMIRSDGSVIKQLTDGDSDCQSPSWSPDARFIVFSRDKRLFVLRLCDGKVFPLLKTLPGEQSQPNWSPWLK